MYWEWNWPEMWPSDSQITLFDVSSYISFKGDHSPGFHFSLVICNLKLLDFGYYNTHHEDDWEEDSYHVILEESVPSDKIEYMVWPSKKEPIHGEQVYPTMVWVRPEPALAWAQAKGLPNDIKFVACVPKKVWDETHHSHQPNYTTSTEDLKDIRSNQND